MKRYHIYRRFLSVRAGRDGFYWWPYSDRLYKSRSYVERKVHDLNLASDYFFYKIVIVDQKELSV